MVSACTSESRLRTFLYIAGDLSYSQHEESNNAVSIELLAHRARSHLASAAILNLTVYDLGAIDRSASEQNNRTNSQTCTTVEC